MEGGRWRGLKKVKCEREKEREKRGIGRIRGRRGIKKER